MRRDLVGGVDRETDGSVPDRRTFLGVGLGCAVPLVAGLGPVMGGRLVHEAQEAVAPDSVFEHLAAEVWRTGHEVHLANGVRGEHLRRLAGHLDMFAVHLRARKDDELLDEGIRRAVREHGREALVQRVSQLYQGDAAEWGAPLGRVRRLDPPVTARVVEHMQARGAVATLRAHRGALEKLARTLDATRTVCDSTTATLASGQKPGDDFLGYGEMRDYDGCTMLKALAMACTLLAAFSVAGPLAAANPFYSAMAGILDVISMNLCQS
jgi:hypothetical protein